jgi:hypothetical protein
MKMGKVRQWRKLWRARRINKLLRDGKLTLNEARTKIGLPTVADPLFDQKPYNKSL